uniref:NADH-ubiquinone oxidoreductase chain 5 n=1 Tax=Ligia oceanica TaxID=96856 RepID=Q09TF5_LIGOC|nr:NADH dehydrogenase subunit 5 [Ligia oceanica]
MSSLIMGSEGVLLLQEGVSILVDWEFSWTSSGTYSFTLYFDWISCIFYSFVCLISSSVMLYSGGYMAGDENIDRFLVLVFSFVASMFFLTFSLNLVSILLGWDGLGLTSYLLVVYYQNEKSSAAGMITALSNRIGDAAILLSIALSVEYGSWSFMSWESKCIPWELGGLLVLAAATKSAQMPFSAWLPAAMAAPTPVSALVHSSTLVTAGVYLVLRFSDMLTSSILSSLAVVGGLTTLMASVSANLETDLKKVIALSTLSQLGLMMTSLGLGMSCLAFFHLLTHATFKALLFMCAGKVIHESGSTQDSRSMGGLSWSLPYSVACMNISNLALCGFPFMAGFYSKDVMVEVGLMTWSSKILITMVGLNVGLSATYSVRLAISGVISVSNQLPLSSNNEEDKNMLWSKCGLVLMSVVSGASLSWVLFNSPEMVCLSVHSKLLALVSTVMGGVAGVIMYYLKFKGAGMMKKLMLVTYFMQMWYLPFLSGQGASKSMNLFKHLKLVDLGWGEMLGGQGLNNSLMVSSKGLVIMQSNKIKLFLTGFGFVLLMCVGFSYL